MGRDPDSLSQDPERDYPCLGAHLYVPKTLSPHWGLRGLDGAGVGPDLAWQDPEASAWGPGEGGREALLELDRGVFSGQVLAKLAHCTLKPYALDGGVGVGGEPDPIFLCVCLDITLDCLSPGQRLSIGSGLWVRGPRELELTPGPGESCVLPTPRGQWSLGLGSSHLAVASQGGTGEG